MDSVKISVFRLVRIAVISFIYLAYMILDRIVVEDRFAKALVVKHSAALQKGGMDAVILGGSNGLFGLSAEALGRDTGLIFYNASLINEGGSVENYVRFLNDNLSRESKNKIRLVLVSSVSLYTSKDNCANLDSEGYEKSFILPRKPLAARLLSYFRSILYSDDKTQYLKYLFIDKNYGDAVFYNDNPNLGPLDRQNFYLNLDVGAYQRNSDKWDFEIKKLFPLAKIVYIVPPTILGRECEAGCSNKVSQAVKILHAKGRVVINQSSIADLDLFFDTPFHLNKKGIQIRSHHLTEQINWDPNEKFY